MFSIIKNIIMSKFKKLVTFVVTTLVIISPMPLFASTVTIDGNTFTVGNSDLQDYFNRGDKFVHNLHFPAPNADINVNYLLNATRVFLKEENIVTLQGDDLDRLTVELNSTQDSPLTPYFGLVSFTVLGGKLSQTDTSSFRLEVPPGTPTVTIIPVVNDSNTVITINTVTVASAMSSGPVVITDGQNIVIQTTNQSATTKSYNILVSENSSLSSNISYRSFYIKSDFPQSSFLSILNPRDKTVTFKMNLNNSLFTSENDLLNEISSLENEFENEPIERKAWRFIVKNRYFWDPLSAELWCHDPALFFNSIGFGYCDDAASVYYHIMTAFGFTARVWNLNGHVIPEVFVNGRWEMYDSAHEVYYFNRNGEIAGVEELEYDHSLISDPINPIYSDYNNRAAYGSYLESIYASIEDNAVEPWYHISVISNYQLQFQLPPSGVLEFPYIFESPPLTCYNSYPPKYTNARLVIPKGFPVDVDILLVIRLITPAIKTIKRGLGINPIINLLLSE